MYRVSICVAIFGSMAAVAQAAPPLEETYLGMYVQGKKIGYSRYASRPDVLRGKSLSRTESLTKIGTDMLGAAMKISITSTSWVDSRGTPVQMDFNMESGGRVQRVQAIFDAENVQLEIENSGQKSRKTLRIPTTAPIVDDPLQLVIDGKVGVRRKFFILDPTTLSFIENEVRLLGPGSTVVRGKKVSGTVLELYDPRASTKVWITAKGDLIRAEAPPGIEMLPLSKAEALADSDDAAVDLAEASRIRLDRPIPTPAELSKLVIDIEGRDLSRLPADESQTVTRNGVRWRVSVTPLKYENGKPDPLITSAEGQAFWLKASTHMPSDNPRFRAIARQVVGDAKTVRESLRRIRKYVFGRTRSNAGIGVLRDATDVLDTREGVCRDFAILTATLARAAGIPTRLVSGLVSWDGTFYYHAWVEGWDGTRWIGVDSTSDTDQISAAHVKLAQGNVEDAFTFTFLGDAKVFLIDARKG